MEFPGLLTLPPSTTNAQLAHAALTALPAAGQHALTVMDQLATDFAAIYLRMAVCISIPVSQCGWTKS
ncbi:MAG: hypothetical protein R3E95_16340 [Thiolinea sp.]